jgi:Holliday junction DNA helicase RuvA
MRYAKMISYLKGKIKNKSQNFVILDVNGVGYKIFVNVALFIEAAIGVDKEYYVHEHVREDDISLYGFRTIGEMEFFELLLTISGIGPKSALGVLSIASVEDVKESILRGDPDLLTKVSGIGRKTAERVVLELREKIGKLEPGIGSQESGIGSMGSGDEIDALMALGYSMQQARESLKRVDEKIKDSGERIREALKRM